MFLHVQQGQIKTGAPCRSERLAKYNQASSSPVYSCSAEAIFWYYVGQQDLTIKQKNLFDPMLYSFFVMCCVLISHLCLIFIGTHFL